MHKIKKIGVLLIIMSMLCENKGDRIYAQKGNMGKEGGEVAVTLTEEPKITTGATVEGPKTTTGATIEATEGPKTTTGATVEATIGPNATELIKPTSMASIVPESTPMEKPSETPASTPPEAGPVTTDIGPQPDTVEKKVEKISFPYMEDKMKIQIAVKQKRRVVVTIAPVDAANQTLIWSSSNENVVKVDENGMIQGLKVGTASITVFTTDGSNLSRDIFVQVGKRKSGTSYTEKGLTIVSTKHQKYTYNEMKKDIVLLTKKYGEYLSYEVGGKSWDNRNLYVLTLGNPNAKKTVIVQASIHGREYMTAQLVMKQVEFYCKNYYTGTYKGTYFSELFEKVCFKIVPMSNPDGVSISQFGASAIRNQKLRANIQRMCRKYGRGNSSYYTRWKANARGIDLNRNFDQYWKLLSTSIHAPCASGFKGYSPVSEKESKLLVQLANKEKPSAVLSYHAMGQIIYWNFGQRGSLRTKELQLLNVVRGQTGYRPVGGAFSRHHSTGYGDWIAVSKKTPTTTIEIGSVACPLPSSQFPGTWSRNRLIFAATAKLYQ